MIDPLICATLGSRSYRRDDTTTVLLYVQVVSQTPYGVGYFCHFPRHMSLHAVGDIVWILRHTSFLTISSHSSTTPFQRTQENAH